MKLRSIYTLILCAILSVCAVSCEDDVNDWAVDPSYDAPFRSTGFDWTRLWATSVEVSYKGVINARKYVFEFSEGDSLKFDNIVRTVEILADTLTVYSDNVAPTKREYRTIFKDFKGTTRYSARMKAIDKDNRVTGYVQLYFDTPAEQVLTWFVVAPNSITLYWDKNRQINKILYGKYKEGEEPTYETRTLTPAEQSAGVVTLTGLSSGTMYDVQLMLDTQRRGSLRRQTSGLAGDDVVQIAVDATSDINAILTEQAGMKKTDIVLIFPVLPDGAIYEIGQVNVPDGIKNLYFVGSSTTPELPKLFLHAVRPNGVIQNIKFQNLSMDGRTNSSAYFFNIDNVGRCFKNVYFESCRISNIARSLVRLSAAGLEVENFIINDCVIFNVAVGGYGFYNTGNANMRVKKVSITKTTMREIGDQLGDIQGVHDMFIMDYVTFCNYTTGLPKLIRWRNAPGGLQMTNNIFTGLNNGAALEAIFNATYQMNFTSCYKTNEWTWKTYAFTNITEVNMSGEDLFVDPRNGDFRVKEGVRFAGTNKAGDPRWWTNN